MPAHRPGLDVSHPDPPLNGLRLPFNGLWRVRAAVRDTDTGPAIPEGEDAASGGAPAGLWSASVEGGAAPRAPPGLRGGGLTSVTDVAILRSHDVSPPPFEPATGRARSSAGSTLSL